MTTVVPGVKDTDFYSLLGLPNFASREDIKVAFRKLALKHHPDLGGDIKIMQRLNAAKDFLDANKDRYDQWLRAQLNPQQEVVVNMEEMLNAMAMQAFRNAYTTGWRYTANYTYTSATNSAGF